VVPGLWRGRFGVLRSVLTPTPMGQEHLIRRSGHIVQDRPLRSVPWTDIPQLSAWDASCPAAWQQSRRPGADPPTVCFSGRTYPQLTRIVRELCAVAGRWCLPLVAVTVAVSPGQDAFARLPHGVRLVTARTVEGMAPYPGQARRLALGFWPECFRRLNVKGGQRPISGGNAKRP
jgi:hypothetical protein